ncbi:hypothetical protein TIFTF001_004672 [Ficus carica]|uniref:Uncharacterized protein n=1 Tax=Ficus carica TaxID=3494 RepID=A0AA87ZVZ1_FICCA|nr:hypothetical protein TIFTF001_004672 [Ficus carica]
MRTPEREPARLDLAETRRWWTWCFLTRML